MEARNVLGEIANLLTEDAVVYIDTIDKVMTILDYEGRPAVTVGYEEALAHFTQLMFTKNVHIRYTRVKTREAFEGKLGSVRDYIQQGDYIAVMGV